MTWPGRVQREGGDGEGNEVQPGEGGEEEGRSSEGESEMLMVMEVHKSDQGQIRCLRR